MSINSIDHDEMSDIAHKWEESEDVEAQKPAKSVKSVEARRRIEAMQEIRESGLTVAEAKELGLLH
ncbi:PA3496 family putative envelope integrity protein [Vibrio sp. WJH972]